MNQFLRNILYRVLEQANADGAGGGDSGGSNAADGDGSDGAAAGDRVEVEARAREWGWAPRDQWRGNPEGWLDAPAFVKRGEEVLPILQANYRKTEAELRQLKQQNQRLQQQFETANESLQVLTNLSTEANRQAAKEKRRELLRAQAAARTEGNSDVEIELGEQIADLTVEINQAEAEAKADKKGTKGVQNGQGQQAGEGDEGDGNEGNEGPDPTKDPAYQSFVQQNSWFGKDRRRTVLAVEIGKELRSNPAFSHLQGKPFFDKVVEELNRTIAPPRAGSKVEGGGGAGGNGSGSGGNGSTFVDPSSGKTFNDLPPEAKAAFQRQAKMVVGEGRAFKTMDDWRKYYLQSYYNS